MQKLISGIIIFLALVGSAEATTAKTLSFFEEMDCLDFSKKLCQLQLGNVYGLHEKVAQEAFREILKKREVRRLICEYFDNKKGQLVSEFSWKRSCWFYFYRKAIKRHGINTCADFRKIGGSERFILSCESYQDKAMALHVNDFRKTQHIVVVENVIETYREIFRGTKFHKIVGADLNKILQVYPFFYNLSNRKIDLVKARTLCVGELEEINREMCRLFKNSEQDVLTVGGLIFLDERYLEIEVARTIALHLSRFLYRDYDQILNNIYSFFLTKDTLERPNVAEALDKDSMAYYLLRKFLAQRQREMKDDTFPQVAYLCQQESGQGTFNVFPVKSLSIYDRVQVMICPHINVKD